MGLTRRVGKRNAVLRKFAHHTRAGIVLDDFKRNSWNKFVLKNRSDISMKRWRQQMKDHDFAETWRNNTYH